VAAPTRPRGSPVAVWAGIGLSVVAVVLLLWRVSFADLWSALGAADTIWLLPCLVLFFVMFLLRAWRWAVLLGGTPLGATWHANVIGYFFNVTLPLRLGEIARAYVISRNTKVTMTRALSAVLVERLDDLATVLLLFARFAARVPMSAAFTRAATVGSVAVAFSVFVGVLVVVKGDSVIRIARPLLQRFGETRAEAILTKFGQIRDGLRSVGSARRMAQCLVLTVLVWGMTIVLAAVCLKAFLHGPMDLAEPGLVVVMANLGGALPSAPAGLGIVQGFATSALVVPFGVPESTALAYVLVWSLGQQLILIVLGFISIGRVGISFREIRSGAETAGAPAKEEPTG
jgi:uncharacterized protein (TIRG00374 family)